jgi:hypothetical protein
LRKFFDDDDNNDDGNVNNPADLRHELNRSWTKLSGRNLVSYTATTSDTAAGGGGGGEKQWEAMV